MYNRSDLKQKDKRKVQGVLQSQTAAPPRHQEEEETDKTKQAQDGSRCDNLENLVFASSSEPKGQLT